MDKINLEIRTSFLSCMDICRYKVEVLGWVEAETTVYGFRLFRPWKPEVTGMNVTTLHM